MNQTFIWRPSRKKNGCGLKTLLPTRCSLVHGKKSFQLSFQIPVVPVFSRTGWKANYLSLPGLSSQQYSPFTTNGCLLLSDLASRILSSSQHCTCSFNLAWQQSLELSGHGGFGQR
jgi:hypothetical protein